MKNSWGSKTNTQSGSTWGSKTNTQSGSTWGSKASTTGTAVSTEKKTSWGSNKGTTSSWGSNKGTTQTQPSSSILSEGGKKGSTAWIENKKGEKTWIDERLTLINSVDIPFTDVEKGTEKLKIHNILAFGMFSKLNSIALRYNDYVMRGGINAHQWDFPNNGEAAQTTPTGTNATGTTQFSWRKGSTTSGFSQNKPTMPFSPWGVDIQGKSSKWPTITEPEKPSNEKPFGEIETSKLVLSTTNNEPVNKHKPLEAFTPRGISEKVHLCDDISSNTSKYGEANKVPGMSENFEFIRPKKAGTSDSSNTRSTTNGNLNRTQNNNSVTTTNGMSNATEDKSTGYSTSNTNDPNFLYATAFNAYGTVIFPMLPKDLKDEFKSNNHVNISSGTVNVDFSFYRFNSIKKIPFFIIFDKHNEPIKGDVSVENKKFDYN